MAAKTEQLDFETLQDLVTAHIDSFNYFAARGLDLAVMNLSSVEIAQPGASTKLRIWLERPSILPPDKETTESVRDHRLLPYECRQAGTTYKGRFYVDVCFQWSDAVTVIKEQFFFWASSNNGEVKSLSFERCQATPISRFEGGSK